MTVYFVEDDRAQAKFFGVKLKKMFGEDVNYVWLDHWYQLSMQTFEDDSIIVLDYCFKNGFRSNIAFDLIGREDLPSFLYTSCSRSEVEKDIKKLSIKWPNNLKYKSKADFTIFDNIKNFFLQKQSLAVL